MVTDAEGLAWLRALEEELGKQTARFSDGSDWFVRRTKEVPLPEETRAAFGLFISLVERRVRVSEDLKLPWRGAP
jgi:hypothetical protein